MKTDDFIKDLSNRPVSAAPHFYRNSLLFWVGGTLALVALTFIVIPVRADIAARFPSGIFQLQNLLCLAVFLAATVVSYRSSIPGLLHTREVRIAWALVALLMVVLVARLSDQPLLSQLHMEMSFYRGRCGPILLILGILNGTLGLALARRAAPTRPVITGIWIALASSALGLLQTQFICDHENFLHIAIWHFLPVAVLVGAGITVGKKVLKW